MPTDSSPSGALPSTTWSKDVIDVAADGRTAQGRFDYFAFGGTFGQPERTRHQLGVYRMGFVRGRDLKISRFSLVFDAIDYDFAG